MDFRGVDSAAKFRQSNVNCVFDSKARVCMAAHAKERKPSLMKNTEESGGIYFHARPRVFGAGIGKARWAACVREECEAPSEASGSRTDSVRPASRGVAQSAAMRLFWPLAIAAPWAPPRPTARQLESGTGCKCTKCRMLDGERK